MSALNFVKASDNTVYLKFQTGASAFKYIKVVPVNGSTTEYKVDTSIDWFSHLTTEPTGAMAVSPSPTLIGAEVFEGVGRVFYVADATTASDLLGGVADGVGTYYVRLGSGGFEGQRLVVNDATTPGDFSDDSYSFDSAQILSPISMAPTNLLEFLYSPSTSSIANVTLRESGFADKVFYIDGSLAKVSDGQPLPTGNYALYEADGKHIAREVTGTSPNYSYGSTTYEVTDASISSFYGTFPTALAILYTEYTPSTGSVNSNFEISYASGSFDVSGLSGIVGGEKVHVVLKSDGGNFYKYESTALGAAATSQAVPLGEFVPDPSGVSVSSGGTWQLLVYVDKDGDGKYDASEALIAKTVTWSGSGSASSQTMAFAPSSSTGFEAYADTTSGTTSGGTGAYVPPQISYTGTAEIAIGSGTVTVTSLSPASASGTDKLIVALYDGSKVYFGASAALADGATSGTVSVANLRDVSGTVLATAPAADANWQVIAWISKDGDLLVDAGEMVTAKTLSFTSDPAPALTAIDTGTSGNASLMSVAAAQPETMQVFEVFNDVSGGSVQASGGGAFSVSVDPSFGLVFGIPAGTAGTSELKIALQGKLTTTTVLKSEVVGAKTDISYSASELSALLNSVSPNPPAAESPIKIFAWFEAAGGNDKQDVSEAFVSAKVTVDSYGVMKVVPDTWIDPVYSTEFLTAPSVTFAETAHAYEDTDKSSTDFIVPDSVDYSIVVDATKSGQAVITVQRGDYAQRIYEEFDAGTTSPITGTLDKLFNGKSDVSVQVLYDDGTKTVSTTPQEVAVYRYKPSVESIDLVSGDGTNAAGAGDAWYRVKFDREVDGVSANDFEWNGSGNITVTADANDKSVWVIKSDSGQLQDLSLRGDGGATKIISASKAFVDDWGITGSAPGGDLRFDSDVAGTLAVKVWETTALDTYSFDRTATPTSFTVNVDGTAITTISKTDAGWTPGASKTYFVETELTPTSGTAPQYAKAGYWVTTDANGDYGAPVAATVKVDFDTSRSWIWPQDDGTGSIWKAAFDNGYTADGTGGLTQTQTIYYHGVQPGLTSASDFKPPQQDYSNLFYGYEGRPSDPYLNALVTIDPSDTSTTEYPGKNGPGGIDTLDARQLSVGPSTINLLHGYVDRHDASGNPATSYDIGEFDRVLLGGTGNTVIGRDDVSETFVIYDDTRIAASTDYSKINKIFAGDSSLSELDGKIVDIQVQVPGAGSGQPYKVSVDIQGYVSRWMNENSDAADGITVKQGNISFGVVDIQRAPVAYDAPVGTSRYILTLDSTATVATAAGLSVEMGPNDVYLKRAESDTVDYSHLTTGGVRAFLGQDGLDQDAGVYGGDLLVDVEAVIGTNFGDRVKGNDESNVLLGMGGDDRLAGKDGTDLLFGGAGFDHLAGGAGNDLLVDLEGGALLLGGSTQLEDVTLSVTASSNALVIGKTGIGVGISVGDYVVVTGDFTDLGGLTPSQVMNGPVKVTEVAGDNNSITVELATAASTNATYDGSQVGNWSALTVNSRATNEKDVFVVGGGKDGSDPRSTIADFQFSGNNAGLTGRALEYSSDKIGLNLSAMFTTPAIVSAIAATAESKSIDFYEAAMDWMRDTANVAVATKDLGNGDLEVYAYNPSGALVDGSGTALASQTYASVVIAGGQKYLDDAGKTASVVRLDDVKGMEWLLPMGLTYGSIDVNTLTETMDDILKADPLQVSTVFFSLEATAKGTVRGNKDLDGGVMQGALDEQPAIFNPGHGDQRMVGQRGNDTYEFITQDFSTVPTFSASNAGRDRIFDLGGNNDTLSFTDALISQLKVKAVATGRESANNSLRIEYVQENGDVMNEGTVFWQGHYQGSARFALETISVSNGSSASPGNDLYQVGRDIADGLYAIGVKLTAADTTAGYKGAIMAGQREGDLFNIMWDGASDQKVYISDFDHGADHLLFSRDVSGTLTASSWGVTSSGSGGLNVSSSNHMLEIILMDGGSINPDDVLATIPM